MTMTEAARLLGVASSNVYRARISGRLPARTTRTGRWLVRRTDVLALLATGKVRGRQHLKPKPHDGDELQQRSPQVLVDLQTAPGWARGVAHRAAVQGHG